MDTKKQIEISIKGVSLTEEEKQKIINEVMNKLNKMETEEKTNKFKEKFDETVEKFKDWKYEKEVKWKMMSTQEKMTAVTIGVIITSLVLNVSKELRLTRKENRLEKG